MRVHISTQHGKMLYKFTLINKEKYDLKTIWKYTVPSISLSLSDKVGGISVAAVVFSEEILVISITSEFLIVIHRWVMSRTIFFRMILITNFIGHLQGKCLFLSICKSKAFLHGPLLWFAEFTVGASRVYILMYKRATILKYRFVCAGAGVEAVLCMVAL